MDTFEKVREDRVRRMFSRQGYQLTKSGRRGPHAWDYGKYIATYVLASGIDTGVVARYFDSLDASEKWAVADDRGAELEEASGRPDDEWEDLGTVTVGANWLAQLDATGSGISYELRVLRDKDRNIRFIKAG